MLDTKNIPIEKTEEGRTSSNKETSGVFKNKKIHG